MKVEINLLNLIQQLNDNPRNEFENGQNNILINLIKSNINNPSYSEKRIIENCIEKVDNKIKIQNFTEEHNRLFLEYKSNSSNKLQAVKLLKDITGCGLKEAKWVMDDYFTIK
jgi:ribosomal protein L7/L12